MKNCLFSEYSGKKGKINQAGIKKLRVSSEHRDDILTSIFFKLPVKNQ